VDHHFKDLILIR